MTLLLNWRLWAALALAGLLTFSHLTAYRKGAHAVKAEWELSIATANSDARKLEQARQRRADEAAQLSAKREERLRADAAGAADALSRLRNAVAASQRSNEPATPATQRADTTGQLLIESATAYRELAATCDRHVNDLRQLLEAWPK